MKQIYTWKGEKRKIYLETLWLQVIFTLTEVELILMMAAFLRTMEYYSGTMFLAS
jgi:hypothetical protein